MASVRELYYALVEDQKRQSVPFSDALKKASEILCHPFAMRSEREEALSSWLQRFQPCLFGRLAAATGRMHLCFLGERDLNDSDERIRDKIRAERCLWKQRALTGDARTKHGFVLV